jgi:hypothetical protein
MAAEGKIINKLENTREQSVELPIERTINVAGVQ